MRRQFMNEQTREYVVVGSAFILAAAACYTVGYLGAKRGAWVGLNKALSQGKMTIELKVDDVIDLEKMVTLMTKANENLKVTKF